MFLICFLTVAVLVCSDAAINDKEAYEGESYDGWYNNKAHPDWGGAGEICLTSIPLFHIDTVHSKLVGALGTIQQAAGAE